MNSSCSEKATKKIFNDIYNLLQGDYHIHNDLLQSIQMSLQCNVTDEIVDHLVQDMNKPEKVFFHYRA